MRRKAFALATIITILAVAAYMTKPSDKDCLKTAREKFIKTKSLYIAPSPNINTALLTETLAKNFTESLVIEDKFLYKEIYEVKDTKNRIGWGAFGWVNVTIQ